MKHGEPHGMSVHVVLLGIYLLPVPQGTAQPATKTSERAAFQEELDQLKKGRPAEFEKAKRIFTLAAELLLGRLGYGVGPFDGLLDQKTAAALRAYEKTRGIPVTGDPLSFETVESVRQDDAALDQKPSYLPRRHVFTDRWDTGYVSASGTWTIAGEEMGVPQQTSMIDCHRQAGLCTEATAILRTGDGQGSLFLDIDTYEIERWDEHEVVTKPLQFGCTRYVKRIARLQKSASGIRSTTSSDAACKELDRGEKYLVLADGFDVYARLQKAQLAKWRELMLASPELLDHIEAAREKRK